MSVSRTTNDFRSPISSDQDSLTLGPNGPILLQDHYLIEKLSHLDRERAPERVVYAKGGGAFGTFTVTEDVSQYTRAAVFQPGARTEVLARFSTAVGEQGSPDTWRDARGFAVKMYTAEGNFDIVGNNSPVFFIRDAAQFPEFIRSQQPTSDTGLRDHDAQWDFWARVPASAHQVAYMMSDRGVPRSWREQNGYGSHTFQWANAVGERYWVKYHWISNQKHEFLAKHGHEGFTGSEADGLAGVDADFHRRDLFDAIAGGSFPSWTLKVQIMPYEDAEHYHINPFDVTKVWPHADYPLHEVGVMELNRNPEDFFSEIEQAAFAPSNLVPGTGLSPDKMLLGRLSAYPDVHRYRIGPDYAQLPVNRPKGAPKPSGSQHVTMSYDSFAHTPRKDDDDFSQPGELVRNVLDDAARDRMVGNISGHLLNGVSEPVLVKAFAYWKNVDTELGARVENVVRAAQRQGVSRRR